MKLFWITIVLLAVVTALLWMRGRPHNDGAVADRTPEPPAMAPVRPAPASSPQFRQSSDVPFVVDSMAESVPAPGPAESSASPTADVDVDAEAAALIQELRSSYEERAIEDEEMGGAGMDDEPESDGEDEDVDDAVLPVEPADAAAVEAPRIEYRDDGSMLLNGQYVVRGLGTEKSPYRLSWELLMSAQDTYAPRLDMFEIPEHLSMFDGKYVQVSGFVFATVFRSDAVELMILRNMWDGCCIGVPPTPYDCIEVKLDAPVSTTDASLETIGVLRGRLKIDPYVRGKWLLGFYIVENASVEFIDL